jgi:acyl-CoA synthetase (AMP-forming)/AMP-acid ligase II
MEQCADGPAVPPAQTVHEAIAWWAERTPEAPALLGVSGATISFGELQRRIGAVAARLTTLGVGRGDRVVLALPDGMGAAIAGLGTSRVAVGVPVSPAQSRREAEPMLAAVAPGALVAAVGADTVFRGLAVETGIPLLELGAGGTVGEDGEPTSLPDLDPDDLALILLTSGTTDQPRRVPVTHRALLDTRSGRVIDGKLTPRDRGLCTSPAYFVLGLARVAESLISGGSALVASASEVVNYPEAVRDARPTWSWMVPALLETILEAARNTPAFGEWPLRFVRSGGALVTPDLIARAEALWNVPVLNGYGATETLGYVAAEGLPEMVPRRLGSVGRALSGTEIAIRDAEGRELPPGAPGEIAVAGKHVFAGYLGDPAATAAAFYPDGWHRTGDLGYLDEDGYLFVTGRVREMINRGGEKIAPHEIDDVLRDHPVVADAAAFGLPHPRLGEEAVAAVILREPDALSERALRRWAAGRLSPHKVPRRIFIVESLPCTGSGKVQRAELSRRFGGARDG